MSRYARHDGLNREAPMAAADDLRRMIAGATRIVGFTGAGISTESGIPDFLSPGAISTRYPPIRTPHRPFAFRTFTAWEAARRESWRRKFATDAVMRQATPNAGHRALARL